MRGKVVMQVCTQCGEHFPVRYLENGTYDYIRSFCDCESDFVPAEGQPSISEWIESLTDEKEEITFNQSWREETIIEITWRTKDLWTAGKLQDIPYEELRDMILDMADKFEMYYGAVDWREFDYNEEIMRFTDREFALVLFDRFSEIPVDSETETIETHWNGFSEGTSKGKILEWFEETFKGCHYQDSPNLFSGGIFMTLPELDKRIHALENSINELNVRLEEIYKSKKDNRTTLMPEPYYALLKERQALDAELRLYLKKRRELLIDTQKNSGHL